MTMSLPPGSSTIDPAIWRISTTDQVRARKFDRDPVANKVIHNQGVGNNEIICYRLSDEQARPQQI